MNSGMLCWIWVLPTTYFKFKFSIVKERQISTQDFNPGGRLLLHQRHGYTHFVALMETQADSRQINLCSKKSKSFNFFCSLSSIFFVRLMRIGKLRFWHKSQPLSFNGNQIYPLAFSHLVGENCSSAQKFWMEICL